MELDHLSHSQIALFLKCGEMWRYRYVEGIRLPPSGAQIRGLSVDASITAHQTHRMNSGQSLPVDAVVQVARDDLAERMAGPVVFDPEDIAGSDTTKARAALVDEVVSLARLHHEKVSPTFTPRAVQLRIEMQPSALLPVPIVGVLDVIDDSECIRDTKTARKTGNDVDDSDQLTVYDLLYRARYRRAPRELGLDQLVRTPGGQLKTNLYRARPRTVEDLRAFAERANAVARGIEAEAWIPAPDAAWWCSARWCGFHSMCKYARGRTRPTN